MKNLLRRIERLESLEKGSSDESIVLHMPDGSIETLPSRNDHVLDLLYHACRGDRTPEMELIAQSIGSTEPDGAHMIDLVRALLNGPRGC